MPYNMSEQPAASINCGYTKEGKPIGLQIAGRRFDDLGVMRLSQVVRAGAGPAEEVAGAVMMLGARSPEPLTRFKRS